MVLVAMDTKMNDIQLLSLRHECSSKIIWLYSLASAVEELCKAQGVYTSRAHNSAEEMISTGSSRINIVRGTETTFPIEATEYKMGKKWQRAWQREEIKITKALLKE